MDGTGSSNIIGWFATLASRGIYGVRTSFGFIRGISTGFGLAGSGAGGGLGFSVAGLGCAATLAIAVAIIVAALYLLGRFNSEQKPSTEAPIASMPTSSGALESSSGSRGNDLRRADTVRNSTNDGRIDHGRLQMDRMAAAGNPDKYNRLVLQHLDLYRKHGIDPCLSGFFQQGCTAINTTFGTDGKDDSPEAASGRTPIEKPSVSTPANPPPGNEPPGNNDDAERQESASIVDKAKKTRVDDGVRASTRSVAEKAADDFVGVDAKPLTDRTTGKLVGKQSADGKRIVRWTSAEKPDPYFNLQNLETGGNLHVRWVR